MICANIPGRADAIEAANCHDCCSSASKLHLQRLKRDSKQDFPSATCERCSCCFLSICRDEVWCLLGSWIGFGTCSRIFSELGWCSDLVFRIFWELLYGSGSKPGYWLNISSSWPEKDSTKQVVTCFDPWSCYKDKPTGFIRIHSSSCSSLLMPVNVMLWNEHHTLEHRKQKHQQKINLD